MNTTVSKGEKQEGLTYNISSKRERLDWWYPLCPSWYHVGFLVLPTAMDLRRLLSQGPTEQLEFVTLRTDVTHRPSREFISPKKHVQGADHFILNLWERGTYYSLVWWHS